MMPPAIPVDTKPNTRDRILELDILRGCAALSVVLFHYTVRYDQLFGQVNGMRFHFLFGQYGVQLFFMISGFVIFMTLDRTNHWMDFAVSRFSRLFPAYWLGVTMTFVVTSVVQLPNRQIGLADATINLSMLQSLFHVPDVDGVYWTLILELCFYGWMFLFYRARLLPFINQIVVGWLLLEIMAHMLQNNLHIVVPDRLVTIFLLDYAHLFAAGMMFYKIWKEGPSIDRYAIITACIGVHWFLTDIVSVVAVSFFAVIFYLAISGRLKWLICKPLVFFGAISYTLYLVHQNIGYVILRWLNSISPHPYFNIALTIMAAILLASAMTYLVEKPALRIIRGRYKRARYADLALRSSLS
ncbi:MAG: acyltransferase family protein [Sulfuricaulis sp.]